jgi:hypothetical protein
VKIGRSALDEDAIRLLEEHNPDVEFDWTRILKAQGDDIQIERRQQQRPAPGRQDRPERQSRQPPPRAAAPAPVAVASPAVEKEAPELETEFIPPESDGPLTAAHAKLGSEGVLRLRGRYAEMRARISERVQDPDRQAELKVLAERLNPDAWVTDADVLAGLDSYESTFEALRSVVGRRRRRPGRRNESESTE